MSNNLRLRSIQLFKSQMQSVPPPFHPRSMGVSAVFLKKRRKRNSLLFKIMQMNAMNKAFWEEINKERR